MPTPFRGPDHAAATMSPSHRFHPLPACHARESSPAPCVPTCGRRQMARGTRAANPVMTRPSIASDRRRATQPAASAPDGKRYHTRRPMWRFDWGPPPRIVRRSDLQRWTIQPPAQPRGRLGSQKPFASAVVTLASTGLWQGSAASLGDCPWKGSRPTRSTHEPGRHQTMQQGENRRGIPLVPTPCSHEPAQRARVRWC